MQVGLTAQGRGGIIKAKSEVALNPVKSIGGKAMQKKKFKVWCVIISVISTFLLACVLLECFLPSFFGEEYRGANHYSEGDYKTFGHGFNRYGKVASEYLPEYDEAAEDATYIDFAYFDSSLYLTRYVAVCVGVRYPEEIYSQKREELLASGTDIGSTVARGAEEDDTQNRLIATDKRLNGEHVYYIAECSDTDRAIMYMVFISSREFDTDDAMMHWIDELCRLTMTKFWNELHPQLAEKLIEKNYIGPVHAIR